MPSHAHAMNIPLHGIRGLLYQDDWILEQIRLLQSREETGLSPRRHTGKNVGEFRSILAASLSMLRENNGLMSDNATMLLRCSQTVEVIEVNDQTKAKKILGQPLVMGMITFQVTVGAAFKTGHVWDLIVAEPFHGQGISQALIRECHARFRRLGVTRAFAYHPRRRARLFREPYIKFGYTEGPASLLEYRFRSEA